MKKNSTKLVRPESLVKITIEYVQYYMRNEANAEEAKWIMDDLNACAELYGEQKAFIHFRSDFARKLLPELYQKKTTLDSFKAIYAEITAA